MRAVEVDLLVRRIAAASSSNPGRTVNLSKLLGLYANGVVCRAAFGSDFTEGGEYDRHGFQKMLEGYQALLGGFDVGDFYPSLEWVNALTGMKGRLQRTFERFDRFFDEIIEEHIKRRNRREEGEEQKDLVKKKSALLLHLPGRRLPCPACGEVLSKPHLLDHHQTTHNCSACGIMRHGFAGKQTDLDGIATNATSWAAHMSLPEDLEHESAYLHVRGRCWCAGSWRGGSHEAAALRRRRRRRRRGPLRSTRLFKKKKKCGRCFF